MGEQTNSLNICYVFDGLYDIPDGVPTYIRTLGDYFVEQGDTVHYLVGESKIADPFVHSLGRTALVSFNGNEVSIPWPVSRSLVEETLEELKPDVLHVQMPYSPLFGGRFINAATPETAVFGTFHILPRSPIVEAGTKALSFVAGASRHRLDRVFSPSQPAQRFASSAFRVESSVLPCPIDVARFRQGERLKRYDDDKTNIVFLGRLVERKGPQYLVESLQYIDDNILEQVRVLIAGRGPLRKELEERVRQHHLEDVVEFLGYVDEADKPNLLASADIAIFPAVGGESFGIVLVEAMAAGAGVVIGGENPGYRSVLGKTAEAIISPTDTLSFAEKLYGFITNRHKAEAIHARQQALVDQYDISTIGDQMRDEYQRVVAARVA